MTDRIKGAFFPILGLFFLTLSLATGCSWSAETNSFRVSSPPDEDETQNQ